MEVGEEELLKDYSTCLELGICFVCRDVTCECMEGIRAQLYWTSGNLDEAVRQYLESSMRPYGISMKRWFKVKKIIRNPDGTSPKVVLEKPGTSPEHYATMPTLPHSPLHVWLIRPAPGSPVPALALQDTPALLNYHDQTAVHEQYNNVCVALRLYVVIGKKPVLVC